MLFSVLVGFWIGTKTQAHWAVSARVSSMRMGLAEQQPAVYQL
jgi:hypothetical protein